MRTGRFSPEQITGILKETDARRLKELEEENRRLKQIVAEQTLDSRVLKALLSKHFRGPRRNKVDMPGALGQ